MFLGTLHIKSMQASQHILNIEQDPFAPIDQLTELWRDVVVPIYVENPKSELAIDGLGSAFLHIDQDALYLVTALHVVQDANQYSHQIGVFAGKAVHLGGLDFRTSAAHDVAVAHLSDEWLQKKELNRLKTLPAASTNQWQETGLRLLWGYPGTMNRLDVRFGRTDRKMLAITTDLSPTRPVKTKIKDAIQISYDHKNVINSDLKKLGAQPALQGMSGGPLIHVMVSPVPSSSMRFSLRCDGVLCEWHKSSRVVVASPLDAVKKLICDNKT